MIRFRRAAVLLALLGVALPGCGGDNLFTAAVVTEQDNYTAAAIVLTAEDGTVIDLIPLGGRFDLMLDRRDDTFESSFDYLDIHADVQGDFDMTDTGIQFSDDPFLSDDMVTQRNFDLRDDNDVLVLTDTTAQFDLDDDGIPDPVEIRIILVRT